MRRLIALLLLVSLHSIANTEEKSNSFEYNNSRICHCKGALNYIDSKIKTEQLPTNKFINVKLVNYWKQRKVEVINLKSHYLNKLSSINKKPDYKECNDSGDKDSYNNCLSGAPVSALFKN